MLVSHQCKLRFSFLLTLMWQLPLYKLHGTSIKVHHYMKDIMYTGVEPEYSIYLSISTIENIWIFGQISFSGTNANSHTQVSVHVAGLVYQLKQEHARVVRVSQREPMQSVLIDFWDIILLLNLLNMRNMSIHF